MKAEHIKGGKSGYSVPNQIVLTDETTGEKIFQSYGSKIAKVTKDGKVTLDKTYWNYSPTTLRYLRRFLAEHASLGMDVKEAVKKGKVEMTTL